ncbi:hypothetical protein QLX08_010710 [Tetragonisca angustula]|uniref:Uncharacterized protein n=1 Tax=Tetragonisca angustula TaxID=166442 RepID=A0AAW0ZB65_9HYME
MSITTLSSPSRKNTIVSYAVFQSRHEIVSSLNRAWHRIGKQKVKGIAVTCSRKVCALQNAATVSMDIGYGRWGGRASCTSSYGGSKAKPVMQ